MRDKIVIQRRKLREKINDKNTIDIFSKINIKKNINCLEIGMGLGSIANYMTRYTGDKGIVIAIDLKSENIDYVMKHINNDKLKVYCLDVQNISSLNKKYDLVHARFVFEHIKDKEYILKILYSQMNEQAILVLEDAVYKNIKFNGSIEFKKVMRKYVHCIECISKNTDYSWGRKMKDILNKIKFNDIQVFENIRMFRGDTIEAKYWINCFYEIENDLIQNGITTEILNKTYEDLKNPKNIFSGPAIFSVVCRK